MKQLLAEEFDAYMDSFEQMPRRGLRVNTLKITPEEFEKIAPFSIKKIPWTSNGYYYTEQEQPAKHPFYYAGLYYIQEPCAMTPAALLPIEDGDRVLDLCAAPGGKSTELAAKLKGSGVLVSNDISHSRAKALLKNIELMGIRNSFVLSETPQKLAAKWEGYFDKILVDAPCSGEGMFRKEPSMVKNWEKQGVAYYSSLQKEILDSAVKLLKPGGKLLYSTCTFSPEENEGSIAYLLERYPEFSVDKIEGCEQFSTGRPDWVSGQAELENCVRLWPHRLEGEGHFVARLTKKEETIERNMTKQQRKSIKKLSSVQKSSVSFSEEVLSFWKEFDLELDLSLCVQYEDKIYLLPDTAIDTKGLRVLRSGLFLGEIKKKRFEPSQALAMACSTENRKNIVDFELGDVSLLKYLKGETVAILDDTKKGWQLICVNGYPLGWGKADRGRIKNKYYAGWRLL